VPGTLVPRTLVPGTLVQSMFGMVSFYIRIILATNVSTQCDQHRRHY
jgi:hypothetical protein